MTPSYTSTPDIIPDLQDSIPPIFWTLTPGCLIVLGWIPSRQTLQSLSVGILFGKEAGKWRQEVRAGEVGQEGRKINQVYINKQVTTVSKWKSTWRHSEAYPRLRNVPVKHWQHGVWKHTLVPQCFRVAAWSVNSQVLLGHPQSLASSLLLRKALRCMRWEAGWAHRNYSPQLQMNSRSGQGEMVWCLKHFPQMGL